EARQFRRLHVLVALEGQLSEAEGVRYIPARGVVQEAEEAEQALIVLVAQVMGQGERGRRVLEAGEDAFVSNSEFAHSRTHKDQRCLCQVATTRTRAVIKE